MTTEVAPLLFRTDFSMSPPSAHVTDGIYYRVKSSEDTDPWELLAIVSSSSEVGRSLTIT